MTQADVPGTGRASWPLQVTRLSAGVFVVWSVMVGLALLATLSSLRTDDFDGLNNLFQIPFALPWFVIPIGGVSSHEVDAWIAAAMGWFNGLLILVVLSALGARRSRRAHRAGGPNDGGRGGGRGGDAGPRSVSPR